MADLTDLQSAETIKIAGADPSTGIESYFANVSSGGQLRVDKVNDQSYPLSFNITAADVASVTTSGQYGQGIITGTPTAGSAAQFLYANLQNTPACFMVQITGTWVGTLQCEASINGSTWVRIPLMIESAAYANFINANCVGSVNVAGFNNFRVRATAFTSGTVTVSARATSEPAVIKVANNVSAQITDSAGNTLNSDLGKLYITGGDSAGTANSGRVLTVQGSGIGAIPLYTVVNSSALPTGASTLAEQQTQTTSLQLLDNVVGSTGAGTAGTNSFLAGGIYNTILPTLTNGQQAANQVDNKGRFINSVTNGRLTYGLVAGGAAGFTAATTANTDVFRMNGSASKTVYIKKIRISASATLTAQNTVAVIKRSTANSGGTTVASTLVPFDSSSAASTASATHYTAVATTLGTAVGSVRATKMVIPATSALMNSEIIFEFNENNGNPLVLRGVAEGFGIVFGATIGASTNVIICVEWDEE